MKKLIRLVGLGICCAVGAGSAHAACSCDHISPSAGFDRAQYVFAGKIVQAAAHEWSVLVDRVWKGKGKLARSVKLKDAYSFTDCEFFFHLGQSYLFFAILAKGGRAVFYHPQVCNWTSSLQSSRAVTKENESVSLEDFIVPWTRRTARMKGACSRTSQALELGRFQSASRRYVKSVREWL
jgi:hypothetical protein